MKLLLTVISVLWVLLGPAYATDYFVSADADNSSGLSWSTAWTSFSSIVWGTGGVGAGDTLYIDGGTAGKTYAETLVVGASGTSGNPITIKTGAAHPSQSSGHDGLVTITGSANGYGIDFNAQDYVTVDGNNGNTGSYSNANIKVYNTQGNGIYAANSSNVKILYVWVDHAGDAAGENGIYATESSIEIGWVRIEYPYQDGLQFGFANPSGYGLASFHDSLIRNVPDDLAACDGGVDFYNNEMGPWVSTAYGSSGHSDGIQIYSGYWRIYNNVFKSGDYYYSTTNAYIYLTNAFNRSWTGARIYNNIFYSYGQTYTDSAGGNPHFVAVWVDDSGSSTPGMSGISIINNTFVDVGADGIIFNSANGDAFSSVIVKNNLFYNVKLSDANSVMSFFSTIDYTNSDFDVDRNLIHEGVTGSNQIAWNGSYYTVSQFNALTGQTGLVDPAGGRDNRYGAPNFVTYSASGGDNNDLHLSSSDSNAMNQAMTLSISDMDASWPDDYDGISRPQGSAWDIGAYEYVPSVQSIPGGVVTGGTIR